MQGTPNLPTELVSKLPQKLTVSIVICTRFRPAVLGNCLRAIAALKRAPEELIIVDNSAGDKATEQLAREFSAVYLIEPAVGLSRARNHGLGASNTDIVAYLDDDALPEEHWLEQIIEPFNDPRVAVVTGAAVVPNSEIHSVKLKLPIYLDKSVRRWFEIAAFGGLGIGTNMAVRKSACTRDLFDERLGRGAPLHAMEEHHAFAKLISQGHSGVHFPTAIVYHVSNYPRNIERDARCQFAYSMLLYAEFPDHRADLLRFLFDRFRRRPLTWVRDAPDPGEIVSSNWRVLLSAGLSGTLLYLKTKRPKR